MIKINKLIFITLFFITFVILSKEESTVTNYCIDRIELPTKQEDSKYTTIIFDIGGVLINNYYMRAQIMLALNKMKDYFFSRRLFSIWYLFQEFKVLGCSLCRPIWDSICLGFSEDVVAEKLIEKTKEILGKENLDSVTKEDILSFLDRAREYTEIIPLGLEVLKSAKKYGYKIYLLSNITKEDYEYFQQHENFLDIFKLADGGVMSYKVGLKKPDSKIYEKLLKDYNLVPEECIFIDDNEEMIEGAREFEIETIFCSDHNKVIKELKRLLNEKQ